MPGQRRCRTRVEITYQARSVDAIPGTAQRREPHFPGPGREAGRPVKPGAAPTLSKSL